MNRISLRLCVLLLLVACRETTAPATQQLQLSVLAGDLQFGLPGTELPDPLQVLVVDADSRKPVKDVTVQWQVSTGSGTVTPTTVKTDERGVAATRLSLGTQLGTYRVQATTARLVGAAPGFTAEAVLRPAIQAIAPAGASAGQTVVITGTNFHARAEYNSVRFDGIRGTVLSASTTRLDVVVPGCVPTRTVNVDVLVGQVASASVPFDAIGATGSTLSIQPGQAVFLTDPAQLACFRLPGGIPNARYLLVPQNATPRYPGEMPFVLGSYPGVAPAAIVTAAPGELSSAEAFELRLRTRERDWVAAAAELRAATRGLAAQVGEPQVGDQRTFKVLNADDKSVSVTAEVVAVSARAILYQDLAAPAGGFTATEFGHFGELLDDPIYDTDVQVFGAPSDIDGNGRIIILFTPRVNALTTRGDASFIAGYFYGCDLVDRTRCADSNRGEIFYSLVPDPQGKFSDARTSSTVLRAVQPVLAHELQHMINFAARGNQSLDALWLSEGLAHTAEDVVGDVFAQRGDAITAREFQRTNYSRASRFLSSIDTVNLIAEDSPGSIAMRGGAFLFLRYLRAHYGGNELLRKLTRTQLSSVENITAQTGQAWNRLLGDFSIALYNSSLASLPVQPLDVHHTFGDLPVRAGMLSEVGTFPLKLGVVPFSDGGATGRLPAGASSLFVLAAPVTSTYPAPGLVFAGALGGPFAAAAAPQLVIYRTR